jgi:cobaltochelatase CobN
MHLLAAQPGGFIEDDSVIVRLQQSPADIVMLSAMDSTLALLAAQHPAVATQHFDGVVYPTIRLANLLYLRQHASVDLYVDEVLQYAKLIIIDHLGGESYWPYGTEQVVNLCHERNIPLAMFSGDSTEDANLLMKSTLGLEPCRMLWRYLREGGVHNIRQMYRYIGAEIFNLPLAVLPPKSLPLISVFHPQQDVDHLSYWLKQWQAGAPVVVIVFYRSHLQSGNTRVFSNLAECLQQSHMNPLPVALASLKEAVCLETLQQICREHQVSLILNTTAFAHSSMDDPGDHALVDDIPVIQVVLSGGNQSTWEGDSLGLLPRDIAMNIALPEVDGRIISRAISFKGLEYHCEQAQIDVVRYQSHQERMEFVVELARRWCRLRKLDNHEKRLALILANYPTREGRIGNGVGLDTPASVIGILHDLKQQGYGIEGIPKNGNALMESLTRGITNDSDHWVFRPALQSLNMDIYKRFFNRLSESTRKAIITRWGEPEQDPMLRRNRFMIAGLRCGNAFVGIQPTRGYHLDIMANYHDPDLIPPHYYLAFYCWLREVYACDAMVHVGKHGNLEWLPGKSVALSDQCWPDLVFGPLPHLYPFIVNDPGEGTQAKRRAQAVIIDHLMPPLTRAENYGPLQDLERLLDEYYEALTLDARRASLLRQQILKHVTEQKLHKDLGMPVPANAVEEQALLNSTDAYLCELKESQIRDGLHVFGCTPQDQQQVDTLLALARYPIHYGQGEDNSLIMALSEDLLDEPDFNPLQVDWQRPWLSNRPQVLSEISAEPWRHHGDTRERLEWLAQSLLQTKVSAQQLQQRGWEQTALVLKRIERDLKPRLQACGEQELIQLQRGLAGRFVPPGPSGAPTRGRPDVLPTGRNFFSVDTRSIPTQTSWQLGVKAADRLLEKYQQEEGDFPISVGISVWGTATMRTGGDDIAQAFALIGVRPKWADGSHRVMDFEIMPVSLLDRPRVDVMLRVSGFFRDAFSNVIRLFDAAVQAVAELDEPESINPIRARVLRETAELEAEGVDHEMARRQAGYRIFGAKPGAYGAGMQGLIDSQDWQDDADLSQAYLNWGGYAYGQVDHGSEAVAQFRKHLSAIELVLQNQDNREHDLLDSDDYYQFQGGMAVTIRHLCGRQPRIYFGDHSNPQNPQIRSLEQEISRVVRSRVTNPKWINGVKRHGYKGAFEMAATVDYLFAYDATARVVRDDQYAQVADAYVRDHDTRGFLQRQNPHALHDICERLLEAMQRGLWQEPGDYRAALEQHLLDCEATLEVKTYEGQS